MYLKECRWYLFLILWIYWFQLKNVLSLFLIKLREFANFDFDIWRKKYMRWMNHKKSRVMDFFRRIDKDQDGKITRQEFIDGILSSSKFWNYLNDDLGRSISLGLTVYKSMHYVVDCVRTSDFLLEVSY